MLKILISYFRTIDKNKKELGEKIKTLPPEIWREKICIYLELMDVGRMIFVCKEFYKSIDCDITWQNILKRNGRVKEFDVERIDKKEIKEKIFGIHIRKFSDLKKTNNAGYTVFFHFKEYYLDRKARFYKSMQKKELFIKEEKEIAQKCFQKITGFFFIVDYKRHKDFNCFHIFKLMNGDNIETLGIINTGSIKGHGETYSTDNLFLSSYRYIKSLYIREHLALSTVDINNFFKYIMSTLLGIRFEKLNKIYVYIEKDLGYIEDKKLAVRELFKEKIKSLNKELLSYYANEIEIIYNKDGEIKKIKFHLTRVLLYIQQLEIVPLFTDSFLNLK